MNNHCLILVGGQSGCGKTTLISAMISLFPMYYTRPISCTTRSKRGGERDDEYEFISISEFKTKEQEGAFLNVDFVYDNYYAMKLQSIEDRIERGISPIKEIHPSNHAKIREAFDGRIITVLVKPSRIIKADRGRAIQDSSFYESICEDDFDIIFFNDVDSPPNKNAWYFHQKIAATQVLMDATMSAGDIDRLNRQGYSKAADDFTEQKRITTRNFHEISARFFVEAFKRFVTPKTKLLEIGPGQGWLMQTTQPVFSEYSCLDISHDMAKRNACLNVATGSVRCVLFPPETYDVVVASLADPYLYPEAISEIGRILKNGGHFIFSLPSKEWATALRGDTSELNKTRFILESGEQAEVYSFTFSLSELTRLMDICGFNEVEAFSSTGAEIIGREISPAITQAAINAHKSVCDLEIVTLAIYQKRGYDKNE